LNRYKQNKIPSRVVEDFDALTDAKVMMMGAEKMDDAAILATASSIAERTNEIKKLIA